MDRNSLIFCSSALALFLLIAAIAFPFAAVSQAKMVTARDAVPAEQLGDMDLGSFGKVSVADMMSYYIENPPPPTTANAPAKRHHFEGC